MPATKEQIIRIRAIMSKLPRFDEAEKENAVLDITGGRTVHISEMSETEAARLIYNLQSLTGKSNWKPGNDPRLKMQHKIIAMAHEIGWNLRNGKIDMKKLNEWCEKTSYLRKEFNKYTFAELRRLVAQFEKVYHFYIENLNKKV